MKYCTHKADTTLEEYFHFETKILKNFSFAYWTKSERGLLWFAWL